MMFSWISLLECTNMNSYSKTMLMQQTRYVLLTPVVTDLLGTLKNSLTKTSQTHFSDCLLPELLDLNIYQYMEIEAHIRKRNSEKNSFRSIPLGNSFSRVCKIK